MCSVLWKSRYTRYSRYGAVIQTLEGAIISHYQIQQHLARGGMSEIYLARDTRTEQIVVIKLAHKSNRDHCERLQREIKALRILAHRNILPVLASGKYDSWCYMVIPYIEYGTLAKRLTQGPLTGEEAGNILKQLASALHFMHNNGMLHRDIKPANILLDKEHHVYLIDFGLVQLQREMGSSITPTNLLLGTPEYMAPELTEGPATTSSDVYALGVLLYQMLTGRVPFKGEHPIATFWKHREEQPELPSLRNPAITPAIEKVILQALEKKPQHRFQTVSDFMLAYQRALGEIETLPVANRQLLLPLFARVSLCSEQMRYAQRIVVGLLAAICLAMVSLFLGFSYSSFQGRPHHLALMAADVTNHGMNKVWVPVSTSPPSAMPTHATPTPMPTTTVTVSLASSVTDQSPLLISRPTLPALKQDHKSDNTGQRDRNSHRERDSGNCNGNGDDENDE